MAVTGTIPASPAASATGADQQTSRSTGSAAPSPSGKAAFLESGSASPSASEATKKTEAVQQASPPFSLSYHFDEQTHRMILEARDPDSGFVVYQMPPKYIIRQFDASASSTTPSTRGGKLDNAV